MAGRESAGDKPVPVLFQGAGGLGFDPDEAVRTLSDADGVLAGVIARVGPCRLERAELQDPFAGLAHAIIYQQLSGRVARVILERFQARFAPLPFPTPEAVLDVGEDDLRAVGLSRSKVAAIRDLAAKVLDGTVPPLAELEGMADEAIVERLVTVRGIGRWTAEMLLMFRLGRPNVLPVDDYGVRKGFAFAYDRSALPTPKELAGFGERWRPYRSVASWYMWRVLELPEAKGWTPLA